LLVDAADNSSDVDGDETSHANDDSGMMVLIQAGLQIGAHGGIRLTQCRSARLETSKTIPVQVDGEPCRLPPSVIHIRHRSQAAMIQRPKRSTSSPDIPEYVTK